MDGGQKHRQRRQDPSLLYKIGKAYIASPRPFAVTSDNHNKWFIEQHLEGKFVFAERFQNAHDSELDIACTQVARTQGVEVSLHDMKVHFRIAQGHLRERGRDEACRQRLGGAESNLAGGRIGERFKSLDALPQVVEDGDATLPQGAAIICERDAAPAAIEFF